MSDFIVEKLTKSVGDKTVFKEISFIIHDLDRIGIIGVNGTGKTTLLDVVSERIGFDGDVSPFTKANGYKIAYLTQEPEFDDGKTVLDTVLSSDLREMALIREYETLVADYFEDNQSRLETVMAEMDSLDAWSIESEVKTVLSKLGLSDLSQKVGDLSGGLRRRVQLAQVLLNDADLLLLDEPTNHLDIDTIAWLTNFLKSSKKTVLFITHDRYFLDSVATRIFELDQANLIEYQGNYQDYVRLKAEQDERDAAALHKKKQLYKQELAWMRTQPQARATKQQARINRFKELKGEIHQTFNNDDFEINFETSRIGKKVVNFEHVDFAYEDGKPILSDFNLIMQNRDRIGIVGDNGVGKSTLLNLIIFGTKKNFDSKKAERYFKERNISYQFIDMKEKGLSKGEFLSVCQAVGGYEKLVDPDCRDKDLLALIQYICEEDRVNKILENQKIIKTPIVRNGKQASIGYQPDVWKSWK